MQHHRRTAGVIMVPMATTQRTYANGLVGTDAFLPTTRREMRRRGWEQVDFVYVCGDAYVDHPSFGCAIITRLLEAHGFKVGIIAQPDWRDPASIDVFGEPRLGFMVSAGNMDSMVNHYTVAKRRRSKDFYSPGGKMGLRPDHAVVVYGNLIRRTYKHAPIILGGIEASLRRLAHYDYWSDSLKRSVLLDSGADLISYGMGEHSIIEIAEALDSGLSVQDLSFIPGTVYRARSYEQCDKPVILPSFEQMQADKTQYARSFGEQYKNLNPFLGHALVEEYPHGVFVIQNPPATPLTTEEFDAVYELPYARAYHPSYEAAGGIPAIAEIKFSLTSNRGCLGECSFCALNFHQGRIIQTRSDESLLAEATLMTKDPDFKGYIHDVGGPTANFRVPACQKQLSRGACVGRRCLSPKPCKNLTVTHKSYVKLLRKLRALPGVKKVFVRSGIRFDYALLDPDHTFIRELAEHHTSGQLRLAPEHVSDEVLRVMGKPSNDVYQRFCKEFEKLSRQAGKEQYVLPYLMSSHPGSTMKVAVELAEFCRDLGYNPEQVSDFYPTPSTVSTCIYYTGLDPRTMKHVYCPTHPHEKAMQRALIQYRDPKNRALVVEALHKAGREDLIGYGPKCLVRPEKSGGRGKRRNAKRPHRRST
ncbi:MAG: YgiQ family radical SAM protein, partial [Atopobiaceae bacterium]|nr:YgiQ family radical SAM protein [Atopobiaceae bacterium]